MLCSNYRLVLARSLGAAALACAVVWTVRHDHCSTKRLGGRSHNVPVDLPSSSDGSSGCDSHQQDGRSHEGRTMFEGFWL